MQSQQPEQQKNLILAIVLSMAVVFGWQYFLRRSEDEGRAGAPEAPAGRDPAEPDRGAPGSAATAPANPGAVPGTSGARRRSPAVPGSPAGPTRFSREQALAASPRVAIDTPSIKGSIALKGGRIDDVTFVKYHETVEPDEPQRHAVLAGGCARALLRRVRLGRRAPASPRSCPTATRCGRRRSRAR